MKNRSKKILINLLFYLLLVLRVNAQNGIEFNELDFDISINIKSTCRDILFDSDGFLWIATSDGLYQHDGRKIIKHFSLSNGTLPSNLIRDLYQDSNGNIWMLIDGSGVGCYSKADNSIKIYSQENSKLPTNNFSLQTLAGIAEDNDGYIWIATNSGLCQIDVNNSDIIVHKHNPDISGTISDDNIQVVIVGKNDNIWVVTSTGLNLFDKSSENFTFYSDIESGFTVPDDIHDMFEDDNGNLWLISYSSGSGLIKYNIEDRYYSEYFLNIPGVRSHSADDILFGAHYYENRYILSGLYNGVDRGLAVFDIKSNSYVYYLSGDENELVNGGIKAIEQDSNGNLWLMTLVGNIGIESRGLNNFNYENKDSDISGNIILSIVEDKNEMIWILSDGGVNTYNPLTSSYQNFTAYDNSIMNSFYSSLLIDDNYLWFGGFGTFNKVNIKTLELEKSYIHDEYDINSMINTEQVNYLLQDAEDTNVIWISTYNNGIASFNKSTEVFTTYSQFEGKIYTLIDDNNGYIWASCLGGGLYRFNKESEEIFTYRFDENSHGILSDMVQDIFLDDYGYLWIATDKGISKLNISTDEIQNYTSENGLLHEIIWNIEIDSNGDMWLVTNKGIAKFNPENGDFFAFTEEDGIQGGAAYSLQSFMQSSSGEIWFGGLNGLNHFYPVDISYNEHKPSVYVTSLTQGGELMQLERSVEKTDEIVLDWQSNYFEFEASILNYIRPENNQFRWKLEGWDKEWYESGTFDSGRYSGLTSGIYCLKVMGSNNDGIWSDKISSLNINVLPYIPESVKYITFNELVSDDLFRFSYKDNSFILESTPLDYSIITNGNYSYQLLGYDLKPITVANNRYVEYRKIPSGRYIFIVKDSISGKTYSTRIRIRAPFYRSIWFWTLIILFILGVIIIGYRQVEIRNKAKQLVIVKEELDFLAKTITTFNSKLNFESLFEKLLDSVIQSSHSSYAAYFKYDNESLVIRADKELGENARFFKDENDIPDSLNLPRSELIESIGNNSLPFVKRIKSNRTENEQLPILIIPLIRKENTTGLIYLENSLNALAFNSIDIQFLSLLAGQAAIAIENAEAYESLNSERNYSSNIINNASVIICGIDNSGIVTFVNPKTEAVTGYKKEEIVGFNWWDIFYPGSDKKQVDELFKILDQQEAVDYEMVLVCKDGSRKNIIWNSITKRDRNNNIKEIIGFGNDITSIRLAEEQLLQSRKMDAIGQLAGGVAHDFNNILASIRSAGLLLQSPKREIDGKSPVFIKAIIDSVDRASDLTDKLLTFGRKVQMETSAVDLGLIVGDVVSILERTIDKKISVTFENLSKFSIVNGDKTALQSALMNMGINSSHAMPDGGEIKIAMQNIHLDREYCELSTFELIEGDYLEIEFRDSGIGITEDVIKNIFEPFFTTKEVGHGTGLGLSAVYGTVKDHKGSITVYSEPGEGTVFHIYLPCSESGIIKQDGNKELVKGTGTILLVDDDELIRITGKHILEDMGYDVILAENGKIAIDIYKENLNDIKAVILDIVMPVMNGRETFNELIKIDKECKVLIASGFIKNENLEELISDGIAGFIHKPFKGYELTKLLSDIVEE